MKTHFLDLIWALEGQKTLSDLDIPLMWSRHIFFFLIIKNLLPKGTNPNKQQNLMFFVLFVQKKKYSYFKCIDSLLCKCEMILWNMHTSIEWKSKIA